MSIKLTKLTEEEIKAAKGATNFDGGSSWGKGDSLGPAMAVAQLRGLKFIQLGDDWQPAPNSITKAHATLKDVYLWLRYDDASGYLDAMAELGKGIFDRAKY